ncbi:MAG: hypothetical protein IKO41_00545 [Lachnospiraceae bacterium]|nr:hypothetical protein [Lachnospiraceae bacterium]
MLQLPKKACHVIEIVDEVKITDDIKDFANNVKNASKGLMRSKIEKIKYENLDNGKYIVDIYKKIRTNKIGINDIFPETFLKKKVHSR